MERLDQKDIKCNGDMTSVHKDVCSKYFNSEALDATIMLVYICIYIYIRNLKKVK